MFILFQMQILVLKCSRVSQAIYMFHALAIVCDVYFVPSLEKISEVRIISNVSELRIILYKIYINVVFKLENIPLLQVKK